MASAQGTSKTGSDVERVNLPVPRYTESWSEMKTPAVKPPTYAVLRARAGYDAVRCGDLRLWKRGRCVVRAVAPTGRHRPWETPGTQLTPLQRRNRQGHLMYFHFA